MGRKYLSFKQYDLDDTNEDHHTIDGETLNNEGFVVPKVDSDIQCDYRVGGLDENDRYNVDEGLYYH